MIRTLEDSIQDIVHNGNACSSPILELNGELMEYRGAFELRNLPKTKPVPKQS